MDTKVRRANDVVIVDLCGKLVAGVAQEVLRDVINELLAEEWKKILISLSDVEAIDSSGIGELVAGLKIARRFGADLRLQQGQGRVARVLHLSQILPLFKVYEGEGEALAAFAA
jgi:anti-sigma B factor antagonist